MQRILTAALATAAMGLATPAFAAINVSDTSGTPLASQIYGIASVGTTVYGSSPSNNGIPTVTFTGDTQISVGSGFAQINDATPVTADFYTLIINPNDDFSDFKFSTQLTGRGGHIDVYTLLAGSGLDPTDINNFTLCASCGYDTGINNLNKLLSGGVFDAFAIKSSAPIAFFEVKQMSYTVAGAVPEPATWGMMLMGIGGMGIAMRRRRRQVGSALLQTA